MKTIKGHCTTNLDDYKMTVKEFYRVKNFKLKDIEYYAVDCRNIFHTLITFLHNKCGVTEDNIEEFIGDVPEDAQKVFEGI